MIRCARILLSSIMFICLSTFAADVKKEFIPDSLIKNLEQLRQEFALLQKKQAQQHELLEKRKQDLKQEYDLAQQAGIHDQPPFDEPKNNMPEDLSNLLHSMNEKIQAIKTHFNDPLFLQFIDGALILDLIAQLNPAVTIKANPKIEHYKPISSRSHDIEALILELNQLREIVGNNRLMSLGILAKEYQEAQKVYALYHPNQPLPNNITGHEAIRNTVIIQLPKYLAMIATAMSDLATMYTKDYKEERTALAKKTALQKAMFRRRSTVAIPKSDTLKPADRKTIDDTVKTSSPIKPERPAAHVVKPAGK